MEGGTQCGYLSSGRSLVSRTVKVAGASKSTKLLSRVPGWPGFRVASMASSRRCTCHPERSQVANDYDRASLVTSMFHQSGYLGSQQNDKEANDYVPTPRKELECGVVDGGGHRWQSHDWSFRRSDRSFVKRRRRFEAATGQGNHHDLKRSRQRK